MKSKFLASFIVILIIIGGCTVESELQKSIFYNDIDYPELPMYSEWGYNTFGAYYDRQPFISNDRDVPIKVFVDNNSTHFFFNGQLGASTYSYYYEPQTEMSMEIEFFDLAPDNYADLLFLNDTKFDLLDSVCNISIIIDAVSHSIEILNGSFEFVRVQRLLVDTVQEEVIMSGVFEFQAIINDQPVSITNGRFDVGVGEFNFFY